MRLLSRNPWCWAGCRQALPVLLGCWLFLFSISAPVGFAVEGQTPPATEITRPVVVNDVPPRPEGLNIYVNDYAGLLTPEDKKRLKERLQALDESGIAQVSVLILPDTDRDLSEFAPVIMNRWDIQHYKKKDGLLVLVNAHRVKNNLPGNRIFVGTGYALESMLPDALVGRVLDEKAIPAFQAGQPSEGVTEATLTLARILAGDQELKSKFEQSEDDFGLVEVIFLILILLIFFWPRRGGRGGGFYGGGFYGGGFGSSGGGGFSGGFGGGGNSSGGGGAGR